MLRVFAADGQPTEFTINAKNFLESFEREADGSMRRHNDWGGRKRFKSAVSRVKAAPS